jgi:hypothetical protein
MAKRLFYVRMCKFIKHKIRTLFRKAHFKIPTTELPPILLTLLRASLIAILPQKHILRLHSPESFLQVGRLTLFISHEHSGLWTIG